MYHIPPVCSDQNAVGPVFTLSGLQTPRRQTAAARHHEEVAEAAALLGTTGEKVASREPRKAMAITQQKISKDHSEVRARVAEGLECLCLYVDRARAARCGGARGFVWRRARMTRSTR